MNKFDTWFRSIKPDGSQKYHQHQAIKDLILNRYQSCIYHIICAAKSDGKMLYANFDVNGNSHKADVAFWILNDNEGQEKHYQIALNMLRVLMGLEGVSFDQCLPVIS